MEWVNWRENTIQILASIKEENKNQTKIISKEETDEQILLEAELLTPPDVILKQAVAEEFTEWEQWSKCSCSEKEWIFFATATCTIISRIHYQLIYESKNKLSIQ